MCTYTHIAELKVFGLGFGDKVVVEASIGHTKKKKLVRYSVSVTVTLLEAHDLAMFLIIFRKYSST